MTSQQVQWAGWPVLVVLAALFWPLWRWWWGRQRLRQLAARIPGPEPWPLVGNAPLFCRNPQRAFQTVLALIDHYGPTVRVWIGSKLYIVVTDPQDIACVLGNSSVISRDSYINRLASNLMGQSLITASGELWKAHRKIVAPAFSSNVLQDMVPELSRQAEQLSATLADLADGATLDVFPYVAAAVLEAVCRTTMGAAPAAAGERRYVQLLARSVAIVEEKFCKPWLWACGWLYRRTALYRDEARTLAELNAFSQEVIAQRSCRRQEAAGGDSRDKQVVLDYLLAATESGGRLSATELQDEVNTLLSAGYETTATTICFALLLLGMYPRVQDNLVAELDAVFGDDPQRTPTAADLRRLHYLDAVIKRRSRSTTRRRRGAPATTGEGWRTIGKQITRDATSAAEAACGQPWTRPLSEGATGSAPPLHCGPLQRLTVPTTQSTFRYRLHGRVRSFHDDLLEFPSVFVIIVFFKYSYYLFPFPESLNNVVR
ncbi:cytochrome P450 4C1-like isoform X2 [Schistocerca gregaria]|uniref:cytochrome P450 4C1-like isoform X2 n=1 Tax=Schistocerca gregaria TaxID=7010 RepID=UPI00211E49B9|nr:cytochrome P450 4C1-like isoform X2 [Schistocerca gregaria]XP_049834603.1 cytochrome P450 4C1-like isoform X2 [Schistocerca gregaria]